MADLGRPLAYARNLDFLPNPVTASHSRVARKAGSAPHPTFAPVTMSLSIPGLSYRTRLIKPKGPSPKSVRSLLINAMNEANVGADAGGARRWCPLSEHYNFVVIGSDCHIQITSNGLCRSLCISRHSESEKEVRETRSRPRCLPGDVRAPGRLVFSGSHYTRVG